jgi:hypothetical protein
MKSVKYYILVLLLLLCSANTSFAEIVSYEAGVVGDPTMDDGVYEYQEVFFLTGQPILLTGTVEVADEPSEGDTEYSLSYDYEANNL